MNIQLQTTNLTNDIKNFIATAQEKAVRAVDYQRILLYWNNRIVPITHQSAENFQNKKTGDMI